MTSPVRPISVATPVLPPLVRHPLLCARPVELGSDGETETSVEQRYLPLKPSKLGFRYLSTAGLNSAGYILTNLLPLS